MDQDEQLQIEVEDDLDLFLIRMVDGISSDKSKEIGENIRDRLDYLESKVKEVLKTCERRLEGIRALRSLYLR